MPRSSITEYLEGFLEWGGEIAYVQERGYRTMRWSYRDVGKTAFQFARELENRGVEKGDRVLIWAENCAEWVVAFFGCALRGAVAVPMDRVATPDFALRVFQQVGAKLLLCSHALSRYAGALPQLELENLPAAVAQNSPNLYIAPGIKREDAVEIVFTSGTTAEPKGVLISHANILANLEPIEMEIAKYIKYERFFHPIRFLNLLPLSHVFGQFLGIFIPQLMGGTVLFQEALNPSAIISVIKRERVSVVVAVPRLIDSLKEKIKRDFETSGKNSWLQEQLDESESEHFVRRWWRFRKIHRQFGWKFWAFISGGASLSAETEEFWRRIGFVVIQGYGLTETTSLISVNHPFKLGRHSIGKVLPGREVKLDESGEILVRGGGLASAYWQGNELKPVSGGEDWFHTGDLGRLDEQGNLYFKGRKKNVIVTPEGMNVYPEDLEDALRRQPEVRDCVVVGIAREGNAEPCAVLILRANAAAEAAVKRANDSLAEYQQMRCWWVWPEQDFPRTSTQKPRVNVIQEAVQAAMGKSGDNVESQSALAQMIAQVTGRSHGKFSPNARLEDDLNLSSIDRVDLMCALEERYQIDLNEAQFAGNMTIAELEQMLHAGAPAGSDYPYARWAQSWPVLWIRTAIYYLLIWPATMLLARPHVAGRERLAHLQGPALIVSNHVTMVDIGFLQAALPARVCTRLAVAMQGEMLRTMRYPPSTLNLFRRGVEKLKYILLVAVFDVFPLPQQSGFLRSFAYAGESADRGYSVVVFPEGRRTPDGHLGAFRCGIGLLAQRLHLPVIPMRIDGLFALKAAGKHWTRPGAVRVTIGEPVRFNGDEKPEEIARELQHRVESL